MFYRQSYVIGLDKNGPITVHGEVRDGTQIVSIFPDTEPSSHFNIDRARAIFLAAPPDNVTFESFGNTRIEDATK